MNTYLWAVALLLCALFSVAWPGPAAADPIFTPIFASLIISGFGVTASTATTIGSILTGILTTAIGVGLTMLNTPDVPKPDNGSFAVQQAIPPRSFGYGRSRFAGYIMLLEEYAENLYQVTALVGHRIQGIIAYYLNDDQVTLGVDGFVVDGADGRYGDKTIRLAYRLGLPSEDAYEDVVAELPEWTEDHRGDGIASLMMIARDVGAQNFAKRYPYQRPQPSVVMQLAPVFDPRDEDQQWDDPSTWVWSNNAALCILHFECFSDFGPRRDYRKAVLPVLDEWIEEINICDELVPLKAGGTERRYRLGGIATTEQDIRTVRQAMLTACDGHFIERGDQTIRLWVGKFREPEALINEDDIVGIQIQDGIPNEDRAEMMKASYTSPELGYVSADTDPVILDNGPLAADQKRVVSVPMTWVQSTGQASRLLRREVSRYHEPYRGSLRLRLSALPALYERWVRVQSDLPGLKNVVVENRRPVISLLDGYCTMEFITSGPHVDDYDAATMESTAPTVPTRPDTVGSPIPANVAVVAQQTRGTDDKATIRLAVSWDAPVINGTERTNFQWVIRWRISGTGGAGWTHNRFLSLPVEGGRISTLVGPVPPSSSIDVQVASASTRGTLSQWSETQTISTAIDGLAPGPPTEFTASGGATIKLECKAPNSYNFKAVQFFAGSTTDDFEDSVALEPKVKGQQNKMVEYEYDPPAGTRRYWAVAISDDGVSSSPVGPETATAT